MTPEQKRAQLKRRGWSDARINQYLKDWKWTIPKTFGPKSCGDLDRRAQ